MNTTSVYEDLYMNMKNRFTVVSENSEYTLGDYMLMKAGHKKESNLPAMRSNASQNKPISAFFRYINDKLALKAPPSKDKTIRRFPFRTSAAAVLSAVIACTLAISYGAATLRGTDVAPSTAEVTETYEEETQENYYVIEK